MKRSLQNSMRSRCCFATRSVGVFLLIAGTVTAQTSQPPVASQKTDVAGSSAAASEQPNKPLPYDLTSIPDVQVKLELIHSKSQLLATDSPITRLAISDPKIIEVGQDRKDFQKVTIQALKPGKSTLTLWLEDSRDPVIYLVEVLPDSPVIQASGVQQSLPQVAPKSEVRQVLEEVRKMRKLIQGLRDDMSRLRESVAHSERRTSRSDVRIQQGDSQVFAPGQRFVSVSSHVPELVNITVLAADKLRLTGVKPGRTTLKCLFEGESFPESFLVEVIALPKRSETAPLRQQALVLRAADHLPGENRPHKVSPPGPGRVVLPNIPQSDVRIYENHVELIKRDKAISRIAVGAPAIVDVTQFSATEFGITGLKPGSTTVLFWLDSSEEPERVLIEVFPARRVGNERFHSAVSPESAAAREQIEQALRKATSINIDDGTLLDAIRQLQEISGVNLAVDSRALEEEGVSPDAKVSLHITGVSLRSVLNLLLNEHNLAVLIEDEVLKVTSRQRAEGKQTVVAYRVDDLVDSGEREPGSFDELSSLITTLVRPESWQDVGGNGSVAANLPTRTLVIRQTQVVHDEIQQLFTALLKWKKSASTGPVSSAPMAIGVDEFDGGRFSGFSPIEYSDPSLGTLDSLGRPISPVSDAVLEAAEPPGTTGAPIEAR